jgi:hypothetical protein
MNLTFFNNESLPKVSIGNSGFPKISVYKAGIITLNKAVVGLMDISSNSKISFCQNDDGDWFVFVDDTNGYPLSKKQFARDATAQICHNELTKSFFESYLEEDDERKSFRINVEKTFIKHDEKKLYPLTTID